MMQLPVPILLATAFGFFAFVGYLRRRRRRRFKSQYAGVEFITDVTAKKENRKIKDMQDLYPQADHRAAGGGPEGRPEQRPA